MHDDEELRRLKEQIKREVLEELRQEVREELKREMRDEIRDELQRELGATKEEVQRELGEAKAEVQKELAAKRDIKDVLAKLPFRISATVLFRYDYTSVDDQTDQLLEDDEINGFRTRTELGALFEPDGPVQAGVRLATEQDENPNPTSPFVSVSNGFRGIAFNLDRFYINVRPLKFFDDRPFAEHPFRAALIAGKMPNPIWTGGRGFWRSQVVWDRDVSPTGLTLQLAGNPIDDLELESTTSYFTLTEIIDERFSGITEDAYMVSTQLRGAYKLANVAFTYYDYARLNSGLQLPTSIAGNSIFVTPGQSAFLLRDGFQHTNNQISFGNDVFGFLDDDYQVLDFASQVHYPIEEIQGLPLEVFLHGEYLKNVAVSRDSEGYAATIGLLAGGWDGFLRPTTFWFTYRDIDNDATLATFTDSNLGAGTGYRGFEIGLDYRVHPNLSLRIAHYNFDGFPNKDNHVERIFFDMIASY